MNMGATMPTSFMIPQDYFASKRRKRDDEDAEIPKMRGGASRDGPAAATGANAAALPKRLKIEPAAALETV